MNSQTNFVTFSNGFKAIFKSFVENTKTRNSVANAKQIYNKMQIMMASLLCFDHSLVHLGQ